MIVPNAHPALISEDEALTIYRVRQSKASARFDKGYSRSKKSNYLLSGGIFKCARCGANMIGFAKSNGKTYYVCGSLPNRKGLGCGPGVYVPQAGLEHRVLAGLKDSFAAFGNCRGFISKVNEQLEALWREQTGGQVDTARRIKEIDQKAENLWRAIEDGLCDATRANERLNELKRERSVLESLDSTVSKPPPVDAQVVRRYLADTEKLLSSGHSETRKEIIRQVVQEIKLAPEELQVDITYRIPEPILNEFTGRELSGSGGPLRI